MKEKSAIEEEKAHPVYAEKCEKCGLTIHTDKVGRE